MAQALVRLGQHPLRRTRAGDIFKRLTRICSRRTLKYSTSPLARGLVYLLQGGRTILEAKRLAYFAGLEGIETVNYILHFFRSVVIHILLGDLFT